jgi:hypothetical protein
VTQLCEMAPLALRWDEDTVTLADGQAPPPTITAGKGSAS